MLAVLEQIEQDRQQEAGANFGIYKSLIRKLVSQTNLSASDRQKLDALARSMGAPLLLIDKTVADLREIARLDGIVASIDEIEKTQTTTAEKARIFDAKTEEMERVAREKYYADLNAGKLRFAEQQEEAWKAVIETRERRRKDSEALWAKARELSGALDAAVAASTKLDELRKRHAALLVD